jgi:hypothetical protein
MGDLGLRLPSIAHDLHNKQPNTDVCGEEDYGENVRPGGNAWGVYCIVFQEQGVQIMEII